MKHDTKFHDTMIPKCRQPFLATPSRAVGTSTYLSIPVSASYLLLPYRARNNGMQVIAKQDQSRARQNKVHSTMYQPLIRALYIKEIGIENGHVRPSKRSADEARIEGKILFFSVSLAVSS